ncbi:MAG: hypothetical protein HYX43_07820 [Burkholderiales bacterium]|nr:hypothetical protein [Burkholderiales bacterium]
MKPQYSVQRGFAAIAAVFLVVALAAFGAFMVSFSNTQQLNSAQDLQGSRVYWAARTGLEWAIPTVRATPATCIATMASPPQPFAGFTIAVGCTSQTYTEGTATVTIYRFTSTAHTAGSAGNLGFVERSVSAAMEL